MSNEAALRILHDVRSQVAMPDYLLPGDYVPEPPTVRDWLFRKRPMPITDDLLIWAGMLARARSLMDLQSAIDAIRQEGDGL